MRHEAVAESELSDVDMRLINHVDLCTDRCELGTGAAK